MAASAIVAENLVKVYGGTVRALDGVSLDVPEATVLGLLGPNGAGKTTAVRVLTTLLVPDSGHATVAGIDVIRDPGRVRRSIGLAGQYAAVDGTLTGRENLTLVGRLNHLTGSASRQRALDLLEQFSLSDAADRKALTYSGGMRRRLDLAAALVARPPVLFLDEPTTGLDPRSRNELWAVIEDLVRNGTTVLLTTQYLEEADRLATRIAVVDKGTVIEQGTPAELKSRLGQTVVEVTLASDDDARRIEGVLQGLEGATPTRDGSIVRIGTSRGAGALAEVVRRLDGEGVEPLGLALREPSLDDVFLSLTGRSAEEDAA